MEENSRHNNFRRSGKVPRKYQSKYNLDHIVLPIVHPDPQKSISLTQQIIDIISSQNIFQEFKNIFKDLDLQDKYYFCLYATEYLSLNVHQTFIKKYFDEEEDKKSVLIGRKGEALFYQVDLDAALRIDQAELEKRIQANQIQQFIISCLDDVTVQLKRSFVHINQGNEFLFAGEEMGELLYRTDLNDFRIDISEKPDLYMEKVREILNLVNSSAMVDAFIYNSFQFQDNDTPPEVLYLIFGNKTETKRLLHRIYEEHKKTVRRPNVTKKDFAKVMFLNFAFVRENWLTFSRNKPGKSLEDFLTESAATYVREI